MSINCYIRKNTPELREKVKELGYSPFLYSYNDLGGCIKIWGGDRPNIVFTCSDSVKEVDGIDCQENEELFLSLAAYDPTVDKGQLFVVEVDVADLEGKTYLKKGYFCKCCADTWLMPKNKFDSRGIPSHRASVDEIIEKYVHNI